MKTEEMTTEGLLEANATAYTIDVPFGLKYHTDFTIDKLIGGATADPTLPQLKLTIPKYIPNINDTIIKTQSMGKSTDPFHVKAKVLMVTPTGDREKLFDALAAKITPLLNEDIQWLIIDDGVNKVSSDNEFAHVIYRERKETDPIHTLPVQLKTAIPFIEDFNADIVAFIEDDDYYNIPEYLKQISNATHFGGDLIGVKHNQFYNVQKRSYCVLENTTNSALATTSITRKNISALKAAIELSLKSKTPFVDYNLWMNTNASGRRLIESTNHVGFKCFPQGRKSTNPHHVNHEQYKWRRDVIGSTLKEWLGEEYFSWLPLFN